jgi:hypothetical protein
MFSSILSTDYFDDLEKKGLERVKIERSQYEDIYKVVLDYCQKNDILISNVHVLTEDKDNKANILNKTFEIYSSNPFRHANDLVNKIYQKRIKDPRAKYTRLLTLVEKTEFMIEYDFRRIAVIYKIQKHKSSTIHDLIKPEKINNVSYLPSELELIDTYHTLYNPSKEEDWEDARKVEKILFKQVKSRKEKGVLGGGCKTNTLDAIKIDLVKNWLPKKQDFILIGPWAFDWIKNGKKICKNKEKIQIISKISHEELLPMLQSEISKIVKFKITVKEQELFIPKDYRTKRFTYYVHINTPSGVSEKPFLDLFTCGCFEVLPYYELDGINIGSKYILLRFLFIDLWIIRIIKNLGYLTPNVLNIKVDYLWKIIEFIRDTYKFKTAKKHFGIYRDANMDKKLANLSGKRFYPYYPAKYVEENNKYRSI